MIFDTVDHWLLSWLRLQNITFFLNFSHPLSYLIGCSFSVWFVQFPSSSQPLNIKVLQESHQLSSCLLYLYWIPWWSHTVQMLSNIIWILKIYVLHPWAIHSDFYPSPPPILELVIPAVFHIKLKALSCLGLTLDIILDFSFFLASFPSDSHQSYLQTVPKGQRHHLSPESLVTGLWLPSLSLPSFC